MVDIGAVERFLSGSVLTSGGSVPEGHYQEDTTQITGVPNRNTIMLAITLRVAAHRWFTATVLRQSYSIAWDNK